MITADVRCNRHVMATRLKIKGGLQTRAAFAPDTFDAEKGTVDLVWTTGARGKRYSWDGPYYEELEVSEKAVDLTRLNNGASVLNAHGSWSLSDVIGVVERAWIANGEGRATVRFSDREDVKPIKADVQNGIIRHVSVGYSVGKYEKVEETDGVPVMRATRWTPAEISLVPIAFDDGAAVRAGGRDEPESYEVEIETRGAEAPIEERAMPEKIETPVVPAPVPENPEAVRAAVQAELTRGIEIRQTVRAAKLDEKIADEFIEKRMPIDEVRAAVLAKLAEKADAIPTDNHVRIEAGETEREKFVKGASAAVIARAGVADVIREGQKSERLGGELKGVEFDAGEYRGIRGYSDLARECLERVGVKTRGMGREEMFEKALNRGSYQTTSDFPVVLANVMHKTMIAAYAGAPDTWRSVCAVRPASDFRAHNFYRNGSFGALDALNEHGEFKNKTIPDAERSAYSVGTKGNVIGISRQALINDDLGAFNDLGARWGRAAGLTIELDFYALLAQNAGLGPTMLDGVVLFNAAHANIAAQAAISAAAIDADATVMALQTDATGNLIDLQPSVLLVPRALRGTAQTINDAQYDPDTLANKSQLKPNVVRGLFSTVVASPRITGTRRYLFADPGVAPTFVVAFLDGVETPVLASQDGFRTDGIEWKVRLDHGVAAVDHRSAVTNQG